MNNPAATLANARERFEAIRPRNVDNEPITAADALAATAVGSVLAIRMVSTVRARNAGKRVDGIVDAALVPVVILVASNILEHGLADTIAQGLDILPDPSSTPRA